jgi:hypothetical protein
LHGVDGDIGKVKDMKDKEGLEEEEVGEKEEEE